MNNNKKKKPLKRLEIDEIIEQSDLATKQLKIHNSDLNLLNVNNPTARRLLFNAVVANTKT